MNFSGISRHRNHIQILRAIALILVVFYHLDFPFFSNGFLGVDIFFVISGYLMVGSLGNLSAKEFYAKRAKRLLPAYFILIIITLFVSAFMAGYSDFQRLFNQSIASFSLAPNIYFWYQGSYFKDLFNPLLHLWSLGVELQFYLLVPLIIPFLKNKNYLTLFLIVILFIFCCFVLFLSPKSAFYLTPFRIWEFLIGVFFATMPQKITFSNFIKALALFLLLLIVIFSPVAPDSKEILFGHPGILTLLVCALSGFIIFAGMPKNLIHTQTGSFLGNIGDYSYSLYLFHYPVIIFLNYEIFEGKIRGYDSYYELLLIIILTFALSLACYNFIEKNYKIIFKEAKHILLILLFFILSLFLTPSINSSRFSAQELNIFNAFNSQTNYRCGIFFRLQDPFSRICKLSKNDFNSRAILIGNSHADAIKLTSLEVATNNEFELYFYSQNDPLIAKHLDSITVSKDINNIDFDLVIIHYQNLYKYPSFFDELDAFLKEMKKQNRHVALIAPVPEFNEHVPKFAYQKLHGKVVNAHNKADDYFTKLSSFYKLRDKHSSESIIFYDTWRYFCNEDLICTTFDQSYNPFYYDKNHLTFLGSKRLSRLLQNIFGGNVNEI